jgi:hypothetical protein
MSTIKVDTIQTRNGTGNITLSNPVSATTTNTTVATLLNSGSHNTTNGVLHVKQSTATNNPTMVIEQTGEGGNPSDTQGLHIKTAGQNQGTGRAIRVTTTNSNLNSGTAFDAFSVYNGGNVDVFGNLAFTTGGKGIDFSSAPNSNLNASSSILDDYEEGTWTPSVGGTTATYQVQSGVYTKVGRMVFIWFDIHIGSIGNGQTNEIQGLPFTPAQSNQFIGVAFYDSLVNNTYTFHFNVRTNSTLRSELKQGVTGGMSAGAGWAQSSARAIASGWYYST